MNKTVVAQITASTDKQTNLRLALDLVAEAKSKAAQIIAFPEFLMAYSPASQSAQDLTRVAESLDGAFVAALREAAKTQGIGIIAPIYEISPVSHRVFDTSVWIDARGNIASVYRKVHLYDAFGFKESDKFLAGSEIAPLVALGESHFGMMICYDLRFPEMARMLALTGAHILAAPSGWVQGDLKIDHWQTMIKARALENGCFVIAPNQVGNIYIGHSMVVDPLGRTLLELGTKEDLGTVEIDLRLVKEVRATLPLLNNRRTELYAKHWDIPGVAPSKAPD